MALALSSPVSGIIFTVIASNVLVKFQVAKCDLLLRTPCFKCDHIFKIRNLLPCKR